MVQAYIDAFAVQIIVNSTQIISDLLVLLVTLHATWSSYLLSRSGGVKTPLAQMLMRDGTMHCHPSFMLTNVIVRTGLLYFL